MYIQFAIYTPRPSCVCTEHHIGRESRNQTKVRDQERWRPRHSLLWSFWRSSAASLWSTAMPSPTPAAAASGEEDLLPECSHRLTPLPMPTPPPLVIYLCCFSVCLPLINHFIFLSFPWFWLLFVCMVCEYGRRIRWSWKAFSRGRRQGLHGQQPAGARPPAACPAFRSLVRRGNAVELEISGPVASTNNKNKFVWSCPVVTLFLSSGV